MAPSCTNLKRLAGMALGIYLVCDGFTGGPVSRRLVSLLNNHGGDSVARVHGREITRGQLDRAVLENLWLEGKTLASVPPEALASVRAAALDGLIDQEILRAKSAAVATQLKVSEEEINERLRRLVGRFESKGELQSAMKSQGIADENALRERIAAGIRREKYVESKLGPAASVTDEEARAWFDSHQKDLTIPERVEARHVFLPTLDHPAEEAKAKLEAALADLTAKKKDFATLAKEISEDPATKENGGSLGWMTRDRLPVDFSGPVFSLAPNNPALVRTRLGWHLVEVTNRKPAEPRTFEQAKPEVIAALATAKRAAAADKLRNAMRENSAGNIEIFEATLKH